MRVRRLGDLLLLEYEDEAMELRQPLVPEKVEDDYARFWTLEHGRKPVVEFYVKPGAVEMYYERYKLVKSVAGI